MAKYLYEVSLARGRSNPEHHIFLQNVMNLNGKSSDYGGINGLCVVSHHMDIDVVRLLCEEGLKKSEADLTVTEITKKSLASTRSSHRLHTDLINDYFLPYGDYPNIK